MMLAPLPQAFLPKLHVDEMPASACSRVGAAFGRTARDFCLDRGLNFSAIVEGRPDALGALALQCGLDDFPGLPIVGSGRNFKIAGESFTREALSRKILRVCPHCIEADRRNATGAYGRTIWAIASIRTCVSHQCALVVASRDDRPMTVHDFATLVDGWYPAPSEVGTVGSRRLSGLERHLLDRLSGTERERSWLDQFPAYAAAKICETVGAVAEFGPGFKTGGLSDEQWHQAGGLGFELAKGGKDTFRPLLDRLSTTFQETRRAWGYRQIFGRLHEWLSHESEDAAYDPIRVLLRDYAIENFPLGPGENALDAPVEERRIHSVHSLHKETGAHPKRLRKLLVASGVVAPQAVLRSDERVMVDVDRIERAKVVGALTLRQAAAYINAPRPHERVLFEAGHIAPVVVGSKRGPVKHAFAKSDLDAFLARLMKSATTLTAVDDDLATIPNAAKRANCGAAEIVGLLLDQKLDRVRLDPDERGYLSVLVDATEIKPLVRREDHGGITLRAVERLLGIASKTVKFLVTSGHLRSERVLNPINRCPQTIVTNDALEEFRARYAPLKILAVEFDINSRTMVRRLRDLGLQPAFDSEIAGGWIFHREAIDRVAISIKR